MAKITLLIELDYDAEIMHGSDDEVRELFFSILKNNRLILHSNEIGDEIGNVSVIKINALNVNRVCSECGEPFDFCAMGHYDVSKRPSDDESRR